MGRRRPPARALPIGAAVFGLLTGAALLGLLTRGCSGGEAPLEDPVRSSPHLEVLLRSCLQSGFYDRDLSDIVPVLVQKLDTGRGDPLKRAKEELAKMGDTSAEAIRRLFERSFTEPVAAGMLENAIDAAAQNPSETAHRVLIAALSHPRDSVRHRAMLGMVSKHARAEDYELFVERATGNEAVSLRHLYARSMHLADPARAEAVFLDWLEAGLHQDLWVEAARALSRSRRPEIAARCARVWEELEMPHRSWVAAAAARAGDAAAVKWFAEEMQAEDPGRRLRAVEGLSSAGRLSELSDALRADPDEQVRILALNGIADALGELEPGDDPDAEAEALRWLRAALDDGSPGVRGEALRVLCELGDPAAIDRALAFLTEESKLLAQALAALRDPMLEDEALARRAYDRLLERHAGEQHRPVQQRTATFKAMGIVPLADAARFLREQAALAAADTIEGLRAHDWIMIQASNTGPKGRAFLAEELALEDDPLDRLDLIVAIGSARDDEARRALLHVVEDGARSPEETLLAASRLVKMGPAVQVAPRLKRVSFTVEDAEVRRALQCLLWDWY